MSLFESASLVVTPNGTKASKLYAVKPTDGAGDLSVTRATTATRVNSAGLIESVASNVPRLDYTNSTCPSILVEPQRTNLFTYSQDFSNSDWNKINIASVTTGITDPANGTTAVRLTSGVGINGIVTKTIATTIGTPYTVTVWIKGTANGTINFNHAGINLAPQNNISYTTQWQKFQYNFTADSIASEILIGAFFSWSNGQQIDFTFAQLEAGSYATSYIPTTTASVTRNADVISKTGISSLIGQTEGTLFIDVLPNNTLSVNVPIRLDDTTSSNRIQLEWSGATTANLLIASGGSWSVLATGLSVPQNIHSKIAIAYKINDFVLYVNGTQKVNDTSGTVPVGMSSIRFNESSSTVFSGYYKTAALWKTRLSNSELVTLTTI